MAVRGGAERLPAGTTVWYTTDGRIRGPTAAASARRAYVFQYCRRGRIPLTQGGTINARVLSGEHLERLATAAFFVNLAPSIRISEVMYSPLPATPAEQLATGYTNVDGKEDFEFVEIPISAP